MVKPREQQEAWKWRHLLDMDGNAFSGRFYAFLRSRSLVYKQAMMREWHADWLWAWVHYVPLGLAAEEVAEAVRWFEEDGADEKAGGDGKAKVIGRGQRRARELADGGREWAKKVLRKQDLEVVFFRLLLE